LEIVFLEIVAEEKKMSWPANVWLLAETNNIATLKRVVGIIKVWLLSGYVCQHQFVGGN
jgi:hypothetical protein